jgi:hypothetical protein
LSNPRIVSGRHEGEALLAVRGHVLGETFRIGVAKSAVAAHTRFRVEDLLMEEAQSLIREAELAGAFDWEAQGFAFSESHGVWEKHLPDEEVARLADR